MKKRLSLKILFVAGMALAALVVFATACPAWTADGTRVSSSTVNDRLPEIAPDGAGGAFITWTHDSVATGLDIYAARLDASGTRLWEYAICDSAGNQREPHIVSDGAGGAVITWQDDRNGGANPWDVYAQRIDGVGMDMWNPNGLRVTSDAMSDQYPRITTDGAGGAVIAWKRGTANEYIVAARVTSAGAVSWENTVDGIASLGEKNPQIASDGAGGAVITWQDDRNGGANPWDVYAQRMDGSGARLWVNNGLQVSSSATMDDLIPQVISDGAGGAVIAWQRGTANQFIVAARVTSAGAVSWEDAADLGSNDEVSPQLTTDGSGGAIITWQDQRNGNWDIYAQRMDVLGARQWGDNALQVSSHTMDDLVPQLTADDAGGAVIAWQRGTANTFIVAAKVAAGTVLWDSVTDGESLDETNPQLAPDGEGGAIITWEDQRSGDWDIYAQNLTRRDFYFAEGYTGTGFQEYLCLGNAEAAPMVVDVTYLFDDGTSLVQAYTVPAMSRFTADVNATVGADRNVSIQCTAAAPFVAERPMYFNYTGGGSSWTGGHDAVGATQTSFTWYFAEGYTGTGFDEWICVLNPGDATAHLAFNFQTEEEGPVVPVGVYTVGAHSRATFKANDLLGGQSYQASLALVSDTPVVAERSMYFSYQGTGGWGWTGGHCVMGVPTLARDYYFAEGYTGTGFEEWLTLQNPGAAAITVDATYQLGSGAPVTTSYNIPALTRSTVYVPTEVGTGKDVSVHLTSASDFLAERPMYFNYQGTAAWGWTGGHCVIGATDDATDWFFAEGYTGTGFEEWLCIQNPGAAAAQVAITYYPEGGTPIVKPAITVPADSRYTVMVNTDAAAGLSLSAGLTSDNPIIVERPMYFDFRGAWTGGHDVLGYVP